MLYTNELPPCPGVAGAPIVTDARVRAVTDGRFLARPGSAFSAPGSRRDVGPTARLAVGNVDVLVVGRRQQCFYRHRLDLCRRPAKQITKVRVGDCACMQTADKHDVVRLLN